MVFGFKTSENKKNIKATNKHKFGITIVTAGCFFSGRLFCKGASRIAGKIEGEINSQGLLVIESEARINADVTAEEVIVRGHVKGSLIASKRVELTANSSFSGNITSPSLVIQEGAQFDGKSCSKAVVTNNNSKLQNDSVLEKISHESTHKKFKLNEISSLSQSN